MQLIEVLLSTCNVCKKPCLPCNRVQLNFLYLISSPSSDPSHHKMSSFRQVGTGLLSQCLLLWESQVWTSYLCRVVRPWRTSTAIAEWFVASAVLQKKTNPAFLQGWRTHGAEGEVFLSQKTPNNRFPAATRVQELNHANGSNKRNLNPWFSFYGSFIFSILYSNFPPFSLASFYFAAKPYHKWEGNY